MAGMQIIVLFKMEDGRLKILIICFI